MKEVVKTLTLEQKESVVDFVANWLKNGNTFNTNDDNTAIIISDDNVKYYVAMSIFDRSKLIRIGVSNYTLDVSLSVDISDDLKGSPSVKYIENFIISLQIQNGIGNDLNDDEFFNITNLDIDISKSRSRKINKIKDNMD